MGVIASIKQIVKMPKKILRVLVEGEQRAKLNELVQAEPYLEAEITVLEEYPYVEEEPVRQEAMLRTLQELFLQYAVKNPKLTKEIVEQIAGIDDLKRLVDEVCANVPFRYEDTQKLLEETDALNRYFLLTEKLEKEIQVSQIKDELQEKVKARVDKHQKEYLLREELRVIQEELGDDSTLSDADEFAKAVKELDALEEVKEKLRKEIRRFRNTMNGWAENGVTRTYIETMLEMPWNKAGEDNLDIHYAKEVLEAEHYGLEQVKERILEFLAVRALTSKGSSPILCLVVGLREREKLLSQGR